MRLFAALLLSLTACDAGKTTLAPDERPQGGGSGDDGGGSGGGEVEDDPPVAVISGGLDGEVGDPITLDGSGSSDPQGYEISAWRWTCSDGVTAEGETVDLVFDSAGARTCTLEVESASGLRGSASASLLVRPAKASWTVMVYLNGDNDLEEWALGDINEMEQVGSTDEVNIVVQIDRSADYTPADGNWSGARRYRVEADDDEDSVGSTMLQNLGAVDSGDPAVLADFAAWAVERFPAERYAFVVWNHGWGWSFAPSTEPAIKKGISWDEDTNNDLSVAEGELAEVLDAAMTATGAPLALIGMDACVMGSWEVAYAMAPYGEVYVSSQDYEGSDGWAYDGFLDVLVADPSLDGAALGEAIALTFNESGDSTQSVIDLGAMDALGDAIDAVATAAMATEDPGEQLQLAATGAQDFEGGYGVDHDLGDVLAQLADGSEDAGVVAAAEAALVTYQGAVLANYTNGRAVDEATGLSIYTPLRTGVDEVYLQGIWAEERLWDDFLEEARPAGGGGGGGGGGALR